MEALVQMLKKTLFTNKDFDYQIGTVNYEVKTWAINYDVKRRLWTMKGDKHKVA